MYETVKVFPNGTAVGIDFEGGKYSVVVRGKWGLAVRDPAESLEDARELASRIDAEGRYILSRIPQHRIWTPAPRDRPIVMSGCGHPRCPTTCVHYHDCPDARKFGQRVYSVLCYERSYVSLKQRIALAQAGQGLDYLEEEE